MYNTFDSIYDDLSYDDLSYIGHADAFKSFKNNNPTYLDTLNTTIRNLSTLYSYISGKHFSKIEANPDFLEKASAIGFGLLMRHALELITVDICLQNSMDCGGKSVNDRLALLKGQILTGYNTHTEQILYATLHATNGVAHPQVLCDSISFDSLKRIYSTQFRFAIENQVEQTCEKAVKKYLLALQKELENFNIRHPYPYYLIHGCLIRHLAECFTNLWCFNQSVLPTDATLNGNYISLEGAIASLTAIAKSNTGSAFGQSSLTPAVTDALTNLRKTSNALMHVNMENLNIANIKNEGKNLSLLHADIIAARPPHSLKEKSDKLQPDSTSLITTVLCGLFGWLGVHHFYAKNYLKGILFLLTLGGALIGPLFNLFQLCTGKFATKKWGTLTKNTWTSLVAIAFMALHIYLFYLMLK